jgi:hypothetical protein
MDGAGTVGPASQASPDVPEEWVELPPEPTQWPVALGWTLAAYGVLGILANLCGAISLHWYAPAMKWFLGGEVPGPPLALTVSTSVTSFLGVALGVVLVRGAWRLKQRKASGVKLVQRWAMLRIALIALSLGLGLLFLKVNVQWSVEIEEAVSQAERRRAEQAVSGPPPGMGGGPGRRGRGGMGGRGGGGPPPAATAPSTERGSAYYAMQVASVAMTSGALATMPLFTGFFLTSRRRRDEWERWTD